MRKTFLMLASVGLAVLLASGLSFLSFEKSQVSAQTLQKPNIVFVLADDMRKDDLKYMSKTRSLLKDKGRSFADAFVSNALCCPSRATIMRGQYAHNTGIWKNPTGDRPDDGWEIYKKRGYEQDNVATRLGAAGYRTGLFGKYINGYDGSVVPEGWDDWFGRWNDGNGGYFDYDANDNGTIKHFGTTDSDYSTDVLSRQTEEFIDTSAARSKPFFAYVSPKAPHAPATPAPRDEHTYDGEKAPRLPSFNEADVSDKPPWIRQLPKLHAADKAYIDTRHEKRVESLQALDDLVEGVVNELNNAGVMSNTYVLFTSDNGWNGGEHRIPKGKERPYEEDVRMPLLVRGPGVAAGSVTNRLALNTDYLPTFMDLAGVERPRYADGRSLRPVLVGNVSSWRSAILLEAARHHSPAYYGIRTSSGRKYVEYEDGRRELYDLKTDPYERSNSYNADSKPSMLARRLDALKGCAGGSCRSAENGTESPP